MLLELLDVIVRYGNIDVLKSIHLRVSEGQIVSIIGSNGAGKTTILKVISGSKRIAAGEILFKEKNIERFATQNIVKEGIAHVPEGWQVFPDMTVSCITVPSTDIPTPKIFAIAPAPTVIVFPINRV